MELLFIMELLFVMELSIIYKKLAMMMLIQHSQFWLIVQHSVKRLLQTDWFILEINERITLNINMQY